MVEHSRELRVYRLAFKSAMKIFELSKPWPREERYCLTDQIRRASRSVCANVSEAWRKRRYVAHFVSKLTDADGETAESQAWLDFTLRCGYISEDDFKDLNQAYEAVSGGLVRMMADPQEMVWPIQTVINPTSHPPMLPSSHTPIPLSAGIIAREWFILSASATMAQQQSIRTTCQECGANLPPDVRYCISCYSPVASEGGSHAHTRAAGAVNTTRRTDDPTIVFLPDQRELMRKRSRRRKRLIVIGAIALVIITAGLIVFDTLNTRRLASERKLMRERMARRELTLLADGLERFRADLGRYPNDEEGIAALTRRTAASKLGSGGKNYWTGPYVDGIYEVDPWGNDYVYRLTEGGERFELFSYGPEGEGGSGPRLQVTSSPSFVN